MFLRCFEWRADGECRACGSGGGCLEWWWAGNLDAVLAIGCLDLVVVRRGCGVEVCVVCGFASVAEVLVVRAGCVEDEEARDIGGDGECVGDAASDCQSVARACCALGAVDVEPEFSVEDVEGLVAG